MIFEHLIYSTAIAIIAGMLWFKRTGRDPSWIIIASAYAPDFDILAGELLKKLDLNNLITTPIVHGDFHNIAFMLLFAIAAALVLRLAGMRFGESVLFAGFGEGAHKMKNVRLQNHKIMVGGYNNYHILHILLKFRREPAFWSKDNDPALDRGDGSVRGDFGGGYQWEELR